MKQTHLLILNAEVARVATLLDGLEANISFYGPKFPQRPALVLSVPGAIADSVADRLAAEGGEVIWLLEKDAEALTNYDVRTRTFLVSPDFEWDLEFDELTEKERRPIPRITPEMLVKTPDGKTMIGFNRAAE